MPATRRQSLQLNGLFFVEPILQNPQLFTFQPKQQLIKRNQTLEISEVVKMNGSFFDLKKLLEKRSKDLEDAEENQQMMLDRTKNGDPNQYKNNSGPESPNDNQDATSIMKKSTAQNRWKKVANVFLGIHRLQIHHVENIDSPQKFESNMNSFAFPPPNKRINNLSVSPSLMDGFINNIRHLPGNQNVFDDFVDEMRKCELFIMLAERGSQQDISSMKKLIQNDPKRYVRSSKDPDNLINKKNKHNQNALYVAAKNGNTNVLKFLLQNEVDVLSKSQLIDKVYETPLQVAVRWMHIESVQLLLSSEIYQQSELKQILKLSKNKEIQKLIQSKITSSSYCCLSCFK